MGAAGHELYIEYEHDKQLFDYENQICDLLSIIRDLLRGEEFCPLCGCNMTTGTHQRFCKIGKLEEDGEI